MDNLDDVSQEEELQILNEIPRGNIYEIGKRRERSVYYRKDGTQTKPLPSDALGKIHYLGKGFSLKKKVKEEEVLVSGIKCPYCDFIPKNALSLRTHLRVHLGKSEGESKEGE